MVEQNQGDETGSRGGEPPLRAITVRGAARRLRPLVARPRATLAAIAGASFVAGALEALALVSLARVAVALSAGENEIEVLDDHTITRGGLLVVTLCLLAGKLAVNVVGARIAAATATGALHRARSSILAGFFRSSWEQQSSEKIGDLQELMTTHVDRVASATIGLSNLIAASLSLLTLVVAAIVVQPVAAVLIGVTGIGLSLLLRPVTGRARTIAAAQAAAGRSFAGAVSEGVTLAREARTFGVGERLLDWMLLRSRAQENQYRRSRFLMQVATPLYQTAALFVLAAGLAAVMWLDADGIASLGATVLLLLRALSYGQALQGATHHLNDLTPFLDDIARQRAAYESSKVDTAGQPVSRLGRLDVRGLSFAYGRSRPVLRDVSFAVESGETVGVIGPSGSGKTTLLQVVLRLRPPTGGELTVGGEQVGAIALDDWYRHVAFVPQDARLFRATVGENIAFFRDLDAAAIEAAAHRAHIHDEIVQLPEGYETVVGPGGLALSGGQQQRVCLARALVGAPDLLVLDEPTSALDMDSEAKVQQTLRELKGATSVLIVAHRLTTLSACDRILVLVDGRVQGFGPPAQLAAVSPFYDRAVRLSTLTP